MSITCSLDAYSKGYPLITNRIRASVYYQNDLSAPIATIIDVTTGHPQRWYTFPGLPRTNYSFSLDEIDGSGNPINNLALFSVTPAQLQTELCRDDEQIKVGVTPGFNAGLQIVVFDGTDGKPNYIGWNIVPSELTGRGILDLGLDYSWNPLNGTFTLLQTGDTLQVNTKWNIHFDCIAQTSGNSTPTITDFEINLISADTVLDNTYFGKKLIVEPESVLTIVTLPLITTVPPGRKMMVEISSLVLTCVRFVPNGSDIINWLRGNLYALPNESFSIYRLNRGVGQDEWRICEADGNFKDVGHSVSDDEISTDAINLQLLDGSPIRVDQNLRLYNEVVLNLPGAQVCAYDAHGTGNNKYLFSLSDGGSPAHFYVPDRRDVYERNNNTGKAGDFEAESIKATATSITLPLVQHTASASTFGVTDGPLGSPATKTLACTIGTGTKTQPITVLNNRYIKL